MHMIPSWRSPLGFTLRAAAVGWSLIMLGALTSEWTLVNVLVSIGVWLLAPCAFCGLVYVVKKMDE